MYAQYLGLARRHLFDQHAGSHRVPKCISHDSEGKKQGHRPEPGDEGGAKIPDCDPPECDEEQPALVGQPVGRNACGYVGQSCPYPVYRQQEADLRRTQAHARDDRRGDEPYGASDPVIGQVPHGKCRQKEILMLFFLSVGHKALYKTTNAPE